MFTAYHSQIDDQSERTNQIVEIVLRFFITKNSDSDWVSAALIIQVNLNNSFNVFTELFSNELMYEFKIRDILFTLVFFENFTKSASLKFKILQKLQKIRLKNRQETVNAVSFANVRVKILHDKRHKFLFLKSEEKAFLRLHKRYNLSEIINKKLSQQKCNSFTIKRRVSRFVYELDLLKKWRIHSVIFVIQLKFVLENSFKRLRLDHLDSVFVEDDIFINKFYEIERILVKRIRKYENFNVNQYLIRWKEYESKFDEWKNLADLDNCIILMKEFEKESNVKNIDKHKSMKTRLSKKHVNSFSIKSRSSTKRVINQSQL
jgi:hypothetical protein